MIALLLASLLFARCHSVGELPDRVCSPGVSETTDLAVICGSSTRERRHVSRELRRQVFAEYGIAWSNRGGWILDHVVPLEAGGANAMGNLWPEPVAESTLKDVAERKAHALICSGAMPVAEVQARIARDWRTIR